MDFPFWSGDLEWAPQACPVCGSVGAGRLMSDHIISEHIGVAEREVFDMALVHQFIRQLADGMEYTTIRNPGQAIASMQGMARAFMEHSGIPGQLEVELRHDTDLIFTYHPPLKLDRILTIGVVR